ncbi:MAG TPA: hypothetical protein VF903_05850 [Nitrospirota bacterium]
MTTTIKDSASNVLNTQTRTVEFDTNGQLAKVTDTFGNITTYVRDSNTWIIQEGHTDVSSGVTTITAYTYDARGNVLTRTDALGTAVEKTTMYTYDPTYNLVTTETVSSVVTPGLVSAITNSYDPAKGNLLSRTESGYLGDGTPYSYTTAYTYNANGKIATIDGPRTDVQDVTTYYYDPLTGYVNGINQPLVGTTVYSNFDVFGNPQTVTDPNGNATTYTYDSIGRVLTVKAPGDTNATQYNLNPVRARVIQTLEELDRYPFSGHRAVIGKATCEWMGVQDVLKEFGESKRKAIAAYRQFVREGLSQKHDPTFSGGGLVRSHSGWSQVLSRRRKQQQEEYDERILGSGDFVHAVLKEAEEKQLRQVKLRRTGLTIDSIIKQEVEKSSISINELQAGSRRQTVSNTRATIARRAVEELGLSCAEIARHLGVCTSSISRIVGKADKGER